MDELKRFEADLNNSEELRKKFEETVRRIVEEGQAQNDGEVMVKTAKELGYDISVAVLDRAKAEAEELDPSALKEVTGGEYDKYDSKKASEWCMKDYSCWLAYRTPDEDEYGHNLWCVTAWHCSTVTLHTEGETTEEFCWSNYICDIINEMP